MIPSTFISASLLESAGDFQLPGCNNFSLHNLTFHFEPLICTSGAQLLSAEHSFPQENSPGGCSPPPTIKRPLAFMYNWVETQFKSQGFHCLKGILYQTHGSQLCRNRAGEQGQLIWGHPGSSVCPVKRKCDVQTSHLESQSSAGHSSSEGAAGWPPGLFLAAAHARVAAAGTALPGAPWCYQPAVTEPGLNFVQACPALPPRFAPFRHEPQRSLGGLEGRSLSRVLARGRVLQLTQTRSIPAQSLGLSLTPGMGPGDAALQCNRIIQPCWMQTIGQQSAPEIFKGAVFKPM